MRAHLEQYGFTPEQITPALQQPVNTSVEACVEFILGQPVSQPAQSQEPCQQLQPQRQRQQQHRQQQRQQQQIAHQPPMHQQDASDQPGSNMPVKPWLVARPKRGRKTVVTGRTIRDKWMVAMQNLFELARKLDLYRASTNVAIGLLKDFSSALKKRSSASPQADATMDAVQWLYEETSLVNHRLPIPDPVWEALKAGTSPHLLHIRRERLQDLLNRLVSVIRDRNERRRSRKIGAHGKRMQARAPGKPSGFSLPLGSGPDAQECRMSGAPCPSGPPTQLCASWEDASPSDSSNWDYLAVTRNRAPHLTWQWRWPREVEEHGSGARWQW